MDYIKEAKKLGFSNTAIMDRNYETKGICL